LRRGNTVSIHAARTGSDSMDSRPVIARPCFNPRCPHGQRRGCNQSPA